MKHLILMIVVAFLSGCMPVPWQVKETISTFDGSTTISIGPGGMDKNFLRFELYRSTKMETDKIILVASVKGAQLFSEEPSLLFKIDGETVALSSFDKHTKIETSPGMVANGIVIPASNSSSKRYEVDRNFIHGLIIARNVFVKINLRDSYAEDVFGTGGNIGAKAIFINFLDKMDAMKK